MNKLLLGILGIIVIGGLGSFFFSRNPSSEAPLPPPRPNHPLTYTGSVPYFAIDEALTSLREHISKLTTVTAYIYFFASDASVARREVVSDEQEAQVISLVKQAGKELLVGIENDEDPEIVDQFLRDNNKRQQHIGEILSLLQNNGYDGVVVDYENLQAEQADVFIQYMEELSAVLRSQGKKVVISVNTETKGRVWHGIDVVAISQLVDRIELNAYEEFNEYTGPGPIASRGWVNSILRNAIKQGVPPEKIILGTAHAGHEWITDTKEFVNDVSARQKLEKQAQVGAPLQWDEQVGGTFYTYRDEMGRNRVVWLENGQGFASKVDLAKRYQVAGLFMWHLGGEDSSVWQVIEGRSTDSQEVDTK